MQPPKGKDLLSINARQPQKSSETHSSMESGRRDSIYRISLLLESLDGRFRIQQPTRQDLGFSTSGYCHAYKLRNRYFLCIDWLFGLRVLAKKAVEIKLGHYPDVPVGMCQQGRSALGDSSFLKPVPGSGNVKYLLVGS